MQYIKNYKFKKMHLKFVTSFLFVFLLSKSLCQCYCINGNKFLEAGVDDAHQEEIVGLHNHYRKLIVAGAVPGQPIGKNLKMMVFDDQLARKARIVSIQCQVKHLTIKDDRWPDVGQNLFMSASNVPDNSQDWSTAVKAWFDENKNYTFGNPFSSATAHYTQVVWAESKYLGCDFIYYYDYSDRITPYRKLYTCNYGPAGNYMGENPYDPNDHGQGCGEDLCIVIEDI